MSSFTGSVQIGLQATVHHKYHSYEVPIETLSPESIQQSREHFERLRHDNIILTDNYDSSQWIMTDEVKKGYVLDFQIDEVHFQRVMTPILDCTLGDYCKAMRIVISSRFGYSLRTLQADVSTMRSFADHMVVPDEYAQAQVLADLLALLPGESQYAVMSLRIHFAAFPFLGVVFVIRHTLQAMGYKVIPICSSCIELGTKFLAASWLIPKIGFLGTCITEPVTWVIMAAFLVIFYLKKCSKLAVNVQ